MEKSKEPYRVLIANDEPVVHEIPRLALAAAQEATGQLAAGIAHEINTPAQYIGDNVRFVQSSFEEIKTLHQHFAELLHGVKNGSITPGLVQRIDEFHRHA